MLTKDLINKLRSLDPSGELEVVVNNDDIQFIELQPSYYDGRAILFQVDKNNHPIKMIIGHRGQKIQIVTFDPESVLIENPNIKIDYNAGNEELNSKYRNWVKNIIIK
jgi:hypothetical protein